MKENKNIKNCKKLIADLEKKQYFSAALQIYNNKHKEIVEEIISNGSDKETATKTAYKLIFSYLHDIMRDAKDEVEKVINHRIEINEIKNADQARKSVAGNVFQQFVAYTLAQNILIGNINNKLTVTTSAKVLDKYAVIQVGDDEQKPDSDVLVYLDSDNTTPIVNLSCKTSCRERAGQTYKWKLLSDLASCKCKHQDNNVNCPVTKYRLKYNPQRKIYTCFITTDFYDELKNPQIAAMFNFFDNSYIAKVTSPNSKIKTLEHIVDDINSYFS